MELLEVNERNRFLALVNVMQLIRLNDTRMHFMQYFTCMLGV